MAYIASSRNRQYARDDRESGNYNTALESDRYGPHTSALKQEYQRDYSSNNHDYTNISGARGTSNDGSRQEASAFVTNSRGATVRESPNAKLEVPRLQSQGGGTISRATFDQLQRELVRQGQLYEDNTYRPNTASIYFSSQPPYPIQWLRPWKICAPQKPVFVHGQFERFDVIQGKLGDCWFVAAMACLCGPDHARLLQRVIPGNQYFHDNYAGMFRFSFWHFGEWQEMVVDDLLPTVGGQLYFVHSAQRTEFWAALVEKAYAKLYGSYEALKAGVMSDSLTDLTGGVAESYILRGEKTNYPPNIVNILFKTMERGGLIGCGIDSVPGASQMESFLSNGLVAGHAYSITDLKKVTVQNGEVLLIRIRNPHGNKTEWKGSWRDRSSNWNQLHPEDRARIGLVQRDDGEFWMDFEDFMDNFDSIVICNLTPDAPVSASRKWFCVEHHGRWVRNFNAGGCSNNTDSHWANPQYVLKLDDTDEDDDNVCSVIVQLMQKDRRKIKQKGEHFRYIGFVIYKVSSEYSLPLQKDFFEYNRAFAKCDSYINTRQVVKRFQLPPGVYVVVPSTFDKDKEADFYIRFFFEKGNVAEYADEPPQKVETPAPTPSPKYKEQTEQFQKFFYEVSGEDMEVNCFELHKAVNDALKKEPLHREIGLDACRSFVSLMDVDHSGRLGYTEFLYLWQVLRSWKKTFLQHDRDNSGKMNSRELRTALAANGYKVSNGMLAAAIFRFADSRGNVSLDDFLILMAKLMKLFNVYQEYQKNDRIVLSLQQWVEKSLKL